VVENAEGNAARFKSVQTEYAKAPGVTRDRMYLDTMQQIFTSTSKVMIDSRAGNNLLYLPLDKLIAQAAASDAAAKANATPPPPTAVMLPSDGLPPVEISRPRDSRSRESSRDRESR
jgi:membrane protease subunit HflK